MLKTIYLLPILTILFFSCQSDKSKEESATKWANKEVEAALTETNKHNYIDYKNIIIKDKETAISIAELVLFDIYGKENIIEQRPYRVENSHGFWILQGTLEPETLGGVFMIIIDSKNGEVVKITHGK